MRGFDAEDVEVIRKAVESDGVDSKACAPGPPMDERVEEDPPDEDSGETFNSYLKTTLLV